MTNTTPKSKSHDDVNHPSHYTQYPVEVIELTRHMSFDRGNAVKYIARAGFKGGPEKELEDLKKAKWYIEDDIKQVEMKLQEKKTNSITVDGTTDITSNFTLNITPGNDENKMAEAVNRTLFTRLAQ